MAQMGTTYALKKSAFKKTTGNVAIQYRNVRNEQGIWVRAMVVFPPSILKRGVLRAIQCHQQRHNNGTNGLSTHQSVAVDVADRAVAAFSNRNLQDNSNDVHWTGRDCVFMIYNREAHIHRDVIEFSKRARDGTHAYIYRHKQDELAIENRTRFVGAVPQDMDNFPILNELAAHIHSQTGDRPNHCIVTRYCDAQDGIGAHHDKTLDLKNDSRFYIFSFGGSRNFYVESQYLKGVRYSFKTTNGSLISVDWEANKIYKHGINNTGCSSEDLSHVRYSVIFRTSKRLVEINQPHTICDAGPNE
jgi:hypothetical protein